MTPADFIIRSFIVAFGILFHPFIEKPALETYVLSCCLEKERTLLTCDVLFLQIINVDYIYDLAMLLYVFINNYRAWAHNL